MPNVEIVIGAKDKTKKATSSASKGFKDMKRDVGMAAGIAVGAFVAFNAVLDGTQKRLEEIGNTDTASSIEDAQQAWQGLADTILSTFANTGAIDYFANQLKTAADMARNLFIWMQLANDELLTRLGILNEETKRARQMELVEKGLAQTGKQKSDDAKEHLSFQKDLTAELKAQNNLLMDADEAVRKMDARGLQKAQAGLAKSNVMVSFKGSPALVSLVQDVVIDGVRER